MRLLLCKLCLQGEVEVVDIREVIGKNTIISSPAGAGKTSTLVSIYTELLKRGHSINEIAAITFTNKAAGEMKRRIIDVLLKEQADLIKKGYFDTGTHFRISTIHSFLKGLIQVVSPEKTLTGELVPAALSRPTFEQIASAKIRKIEPESLLGQVAGKKLMKYLLNLFDAVPVSYVWAKEVASSGPPRSHFGDYELVREFTTELADLFLETFEDYQRWKKENGFFEYSDIEIRAYDAVVNSGDVSDILLVFNESMSALLVDEFQDTSELQWRILRKLSEDWLSGEGLREVADSAVYLVGDPKQSIYSFRGADVSVMQKVMEQFQELAERDGRHYAHVSLPKNYRSTPSVVEFVNRVFSDLMLSQIDRKKPWKTVYEHFEPDRTSEYSNVFIVVSDEEKKAGEAAAFEAGFIADDISRLVADGVVIQDRDGKTRRLELSDIAILVRTRTHIDRYENALISKGIPFVSLDSGYTSLKPFEFLKSFFQLFEPTRQHGAAVAITQLIDEESLDVRSVEDLEKLKFPFSRIYDAYHVFLIDFKTGVYSAYRSALNILHEIMEIKFPDPEERELAVRLFDELMAAMDAAGVSSPLELAQRLEHSLEEYLPEISTRASAVQILSIHKAKGLEFPVVFAASLWAAGMNRRPTFLPTEFDSPAIARFFPSRLEKNETSNPYLSKELKQLEKDMKNDISEFKQEEAKRLYYVAFTRARDYLYVMLPRVSKSVKEYKDLKEILMKNRETVEVIEPEETVISQAAPEVEQASKGFYSRRIEKTTYQLPDFLAGYEPRNRLAVRKEPASRRIPPPVRFRQSVELGSILHGLLQRYFNEGQIPEEEIPPAARDIFSSFVKEAEVSGLFAGDRLTEVETIELQGDGFIKAKIDLLVFDDSAVRIIDYKTETYSADSTSKYRSQLETYRRIVSSIYPEKSVECYLVFLKDMKFVRVV